MPSAQRSVTIRRPAMDVFAFLADGLNGPKWRSGVLDVEHVSGTGLGAQYKQGVKGPGGRRIAADYEITEFVPSEKLAIQAIAGLVRPIGQYVLAEEGGETRLTFSLDAQLSGWKSLLMSRAVQRAMDAEMAALDRLKAVLEG